MTISLFSRLIRDAGGEMGVTGVNKLAMTKRPEEQSFLVNSILMAHWSRLETELSSTETAMNPSNLLIALAVLPESRDLTDDFFFI